MKKPPNSKCDGCGRVAHKNCTIIMSGKRYCKGRCQGEQEYLREEALYQSTPEAIEAEREYALEQVCSICNEENAIYRDWFSAERRASDSKVVFQPVHKGQRNVVGRLS